MASTRSYRILHDEVVARPGATERLSALRDETLAEIVRWELCGGGCVMMCWVVGYCCGLVV